MVAVFLSRPGGIKIAKNDSSADRLAAIQTKTHIQTWY
jgi:hypothetical protein